MQHNKKGGSISFEATKLAVRSYLIHNVKDLDFRVNLYKGFLSKYRKSTPAQLNTLLSGVETKTAKKELIAQTKTRIIQMQRERKLLKYLLSSLRKTKVSDIFPGASS